MNQEQKTARAAELYCWLCQLVPRNTGITIHIDARYIVHSTKLIASARYCWKGLRKWFTGVSFYNWVCVLWFCVKTLLYHGLFYFLFIVFFNTNFFNGFDDEVHSFHTSFSLYNFIILIFCFWIRPIISLSFYHHVIIFSESWYYNGIKRSILCSCTNIHNLNWKLF